MSTQGSKPEWFQMAEADWAASPRAKNAKAVKVSRNNPIRLMAISAPLLVLGAGLLFAQTQQVPDAFAAASTTVTSSAPDQSSVAAGITSANSVQTPAINTPRVSATRASNALSTLQSGLKLPAKGSIQSDDDGNNSGEGEND